MRRIIGGTPISHFGRESDGRLFPMRQPPSRLERGGPQVPNEKEGPVVQKSYTSFKIGISFKKLTITAFLLKSACDEGLHRKPGKF